MLIIKVFGCVLFSYEQMGSWRMTSDILSFPSAINFKEISEALRKIFHSSHQRHSVDGVGGQIPTHLAISIPFICIDPHG